VIEDTSSNAVQAIFILGKNNARPESLYHKAT
jgi:hypothetical protein